MAGRATGVSTRGAVIGAVVVIGVSVALGVGIDLANRSGSEGSDRPKLTRSGSKLVDREPDQLLLPTRVLNSYEVVYRVEIPTPDSLSVNTERVVVRRPFDGLFESFSGPPPGRARTTRRVTRFAALGIDNNAGRTSIINPPPSIASSDVRADIAIGDAVERGDAKAREVREVGGRRCQVFRVGTTVTTGNLVPFTDPAKEYADVCIDASGVVREEVWSKDGQWIRRRLASRVTENPTLDDDTFVLPNEVVVPFDEGNGFVRPVDPGTLPEGRGWTGPGPAQAGFEYRGRFAVSPPDLRAIKQPLEEERRGGVSVVDVWDRGRDLIVIEQGIAQTEQGAFQPNPNGRTVNLGALGTGEAVLDFRLNEARTLFQDGRFVRVYGTLPLDDVVALASTLTPVEGGGLKFL